MRNLNFIELLEWEIGNEHPFNVVFTAKIPSKLSEKIFIQSLVSLIRKYPLLSSRVTCSSGHYEFEHIDICPELKYEEIDNTKLTAKLKNNLVNYELNKKFSSDTTLFRCHCVVTKSESLLLLTFHHVISDGISAISILFDLLNTYEALSKNQKIKNHYQKVLPALENLLPNHLNIQARPHRSIRNMTTNKNTESQSTIFHTFSFSRNHTTLLLNKCKQHKITVQGLISSAGCSALRKHQNIDTDYKIMTHHLVNIRPFLDKFISSQDLACIISQINIPISISDTSIILDNAYRISNELHENLKNGEHWNTLKKIDSWIAQHSGSQAIQTGAKSKDLLFSLSNLGKVNMPSTLSPHLTPTELHGYVTIHNLYPEKHTIMAVALTYNQSLHISLLGSYPSITNSELNGLAITMKNCLLETINVY